MVWSWDCSSYCYNIGPLAWRLTNYEWLGLESKENITYEKFTYDQSSLLTLIWVSA